MMLVEGQANEPQKLESKVHFHHDHYGHMLMHVAMRKQDDTSLHYFSRTVQCNDMPSEIVSVWYLTKFCPLRI